MQQQQKEIPAFYCMPIKDGIEKKNALRGITWKNGIYTIWKPAVNNSIIRCGKGACTLQPSILSVIDIDIEKNTGYNPRAVLTELYNEWIISENTFQVVQTGNGGLHLYYLIVNPEDFNVPSAQNINVSWRKDLEKILEDNGLKLKGIDIRANNGVVFAPNTRFIGGNKYKIIEKKQLTITKEQYKQMDVMSNRPINENNTEDNKHTYEWNNPKIGIAGGISRDDGVQRFMANAIKPGARIDENEFKTIIKEKTHDAFYQIFYGNKNLTKVNKFKLFSAIYREFGARIQNPIVLVNICQQFNLLENIIDYDKSIHQLNVILSNPKTAWWYTVPPSTEMWNDVVRTLNLKYESNKKHTHINGIITAEKWAPGPVVDIIKQRLAANNEFMCMYNNSFYLFRKGLWIELSPADHYNTDLLQIITTYYNEIMNMKGIQYKIREILFLMKSTLEVKELIHNNDYVLFENCLLDLRQRKTVPYNKDIIQLARMPFKYINENVSLNPKFKEFLEATFFNEHDEINKVLQFIGYTITRRNDWQRALLLLGSGGNGKSVLLNIWSKIVPSASHSLHSLNEKFAMSIFKHYALNLMDEIDANLTLSSVTLLKTLVGNSSRVLIREMYKNADVITNIAPRFVFAANDTLPKLPRGTDDGFYRKWIILRMNKFNMKTNVVDFNLEKKLSRQNILDNIGTYCINKYLENTTPKWLNEYTAAENKNTWNNTLYNPIIDWIDSYVNIKNLNNANSFTSREDLLNSYNAYLESINYRTISLKSFLMQLKDVAIWHGVTSIRKRINDKLIRGYKIDLL